MTCVLRVLLMAGFKEDRSLHSGTEQYYLHPAGSAVGGPH